MSDQNGPSVTSCIGARASSGGPAFRRALNCSCGSIIDEPV